MEKIYNIRIPKEDHKDLQEFCEVINRAVPKGVERFKPETLARFLILRSIDFFHTDPSQIARYLEAIFNPEGGTMVSINFDREQLHQVIEGIGHRIEHIMANRADYEAEELEAARSALDLLTAVAHSAQQAPASPAMG